MKDCWSCKLLAVEATRLDLDMQNKQKRVREDLTLSIRKVNNMVRTLRKSGPTATTEGGSGRGGDDNDDEDNLLHLEPADQLALRVEIASAEIERASHYDACRRLRRTGVVFRARRDRLERRLRCLTGGVRETVVALERVMGELRKQLSLARVQERVFQEEAEDVERKGLNARRRLTVVNEQLALLQRHPYKVRTAILSCHRMPKILIYINEPPCRSALCSWCKQCLHDRRTSDVLHPAIVGMRGPMFFYRLRTCMTSPPPRPPPALGTSAPTAFHPSIVTALKWADSDAWQPGYVQRLETAELNKLLAEEGAQLQAISDETSIQSARAHELRSQAALQGKSFTAIMRGVGALVSLLTTALEDESFAKDLESAAEAQSMLENDSLATDAEYSSAATRGGGNGKSRAKRQRRRRGLPSHAERVRAAPHRKRTSDEKRWVALDAVLNPQLYHHVTLPEAEEMRWDTLYYTRLDRDDIVRVLALPSQIQLALPFLHTPAEVDAHELLGRYTLGISGDHFARLDKNSQDACITGPSTGPGIVPGTGLSTGKTTKSFPRPDSGSQDACITDPSTAPRTDPATKSEAAATLEEGAGNADSAASGSVAASVSPAEEVDVTSVPRGVLARMRRGVEAQLKLSAERIEEESVWLVLDRKLRPMLYQDEDDAAGEEHEQLLREADAREDARHTWLAASQSKEANKNGSGDGTLVPSPQKENNEIRGRGALGSVVEKKYIVEAGVEIAGGITAAAVVGQNESCEEDLATRVANAFDEHDVKRLAAGGLEVSDDGRPGLPGVVDQGGPFLSTSATVSTPRMDEGAELSMIATTEITDGGKGLRNVPGEVNEADDTAANANVSPRKRLEEIAHQVLARYFVREEDTPLGRTMTQSLAILQEVALRLCKGQSDVFSRLNQHTAYAILVSSTQARTLAEESAPSRTSVTTTTPVKNMTVSVTPAKHNAVSLNFAKNTAEGGEEIALLVPKEEEPPIAVAAPFLTSAESTPTVSADKALLSTHAQEVSNSGGSSSDGAGDVHAREIGDETSCMGSKNVTKTSSRVAIRSSASPQGRETSTTGDCEQAVTTPYCVDTRSSAPPQGRGTSSTGGSKQAITNPSRVGIRSYASGQGRGNSTAGDIQQAVTSPSRATIESSEFQRKRNSTPGRDGRSAKGDGLRANEDRVEDVDDASGGAMEGQRKVFGSWEEVHPASLGVGSQEKNFPAGAKEAVEEQAHPASFGSSASEGMANANVGVKT